MTAAVRILIVDDSVVIRKLLTQTLAEAPGLEVVGTAGLGRIALTKIPECHPDVVILDIEMPEMDGIETLKRIRKESPRLPVIMFSTKTERGAAATIEALTSGASDFVTKPSNVGNVLLAMSRVREELVPKIFALTARMRALRDRPVSAPLPVMPAAGGGPMAPFAAPRPTTFAGNVAIAAPRTRTNTTMAPAPRLPASATTPPLAAAAMLAHAPAVVPHHAHAHAPAPPRPRGHTAPFITPGQFRIPRQIGPRLPIEIVAIGASTGGPNALAVLLSQLPAELPVPVVIVQHMLATFTRHFTERLASQCQLHIVEANAGDPLLPGHAYIARGDYHMLIERRGGKPTVVTNQDPLENFCRPAVDVLFRSVAQTYGPSALGVVLTGMGHDGLLGCGAIREAGGDVVVQDEASSVVWGMPGFVARAGLASQVLPLDYIGPEVRRRVQLGAARAAQGTAP